MGTIRAVIVGDGEVDLAALEAALRQAGDEGVLAIGADGGSRNLEAVGRTPDLVCGDADSMRPEDVARLRAAGATVEIHPAEKDESDLELCIRAALERGATRLEIHGALFGARVEHSIANELLLANPRLDRIDVAIRHAGSTIRRIGSAVEPGMLEISGQVGDFVSLLPLDDLVVGVATEGLRYPLRRESLALGSTRGLSNELTGPRARVQTIAGRLLVIHTPRPTATGDSA